VTTTEGTVEDVGWPFLVSAGRVRDYSVLVAPDFLVASGEQGLLGVTGAAVEGDGVKISTVQTSSGRQLFLAYAARLVTPEDAGPAGGVVDPADWVADEFGRPLRVVVGVLADHPRATDPTADVERAEQSVLDSYRRFRTDEATWRVEASRSAPMVSLGLRPLVDSSSSRGHTAPRPVDAPAPPEERIPVGAGQRLGPGVLVSLVVLALLVVALLAVRPWRSDDCPPAPTPTTTTTTTSARSGPAEPAGQPKQKSDTAACP
jgi:hypothetical protein